MKKRSNHFKTIQSRSVMGCHFLIPIFDFNDTSATILFRDEIDIYFTLKNSSLDMIERLTPCPRMVSDYVLKIKTDFVAPSGVYQSDVWKTYGGLNESFQNVYLTTNDRLAEIDLDQFMEIVTMNRNVVEIVERECNDPIFYDWILEPLKEKI